MVKLHLGNGRNHLDGWVNIDSVSNPEVDLVHDLRNGLPMYQANSIEAVFSNHFFEHLTWDEGQRLLKECYRVLKVGGIIKTQMPDLDWLISMYLRKPFVDPTYNIAYDGKLASFLSHGEYLISRGYAFNKSMTMWGESHQYLYNGEDFRKQLESAGFKNVERITMRFGEVSISETEYGRMIGDGKKPNVTGKLVDIGWRAHNAFLIMEAEK